MLRLTGGQVESLSDGLLPVEVRELPEDLAALDRLLADPWAAGADHPGLGADHPPARPANHPDG